MQSTEVWHYQVADQSIQTFSVTDCQVSSTPPSVSDGSTYSVYCISVSIWSHLPTPYCSANDSSRVSKRLWQTSENNVPIYKEKWYEHGHVWIYNQ